MKLIPSYYNSIKYDLIGQDIETQKPKLINESKPNEQFNEVNLSTYGFTCVHARTLNNSST